jgi:hypothetical protein
MKHEFHRARECSRVLIQTARSGVLTKPRPPAIFVSDALETTLDLFVDATILLPQNSTYCRVTDLLEVAPVVVAREASGVVARSWASLLFGIIWNLRTIVHTLRSIRRPWLNAIHCAARGRTVCDFDDYGREDVAPSGDDDDDSSSSSGNSSISIRVMPLGVFVGSVVVGDDSSSLPPPPADGRASSS